MSDTRSLNPDAPPTQPSRWFIRALLAAAYLAALLPPVYIGMTRLHDMVLGLPISVWYMFAVCLFATALVGVLYAYEHARGELD